MSAIAMPIDLKPGYYLEASVYKQLARLAALAFLLHDGGIDEDVIFNYINGDISNELYSALELESKTIAPEFTNYGQQAK